MHRDTICGLMLIGLGILLAAFTIYTGTAPDDRDITGAVFVIMLGFTALFDSHSTKTRKSVKYHLKESK